VLRCSRSIILRFSGESCGSRLTGGLNLRRFGKGIIREHYGTLQKRAQSESDILEQCYKDATTDLERPRVADKRVDEICQCTTNRSIARFLLACLLAKTHQPIVDIRKPYTETGGAGCYSGRSYDEEFVSEFIVRYNRP